MGTGPTVTRLAVRAGGPVAMLAVCAVGPVGIRAGGPVAMLAVRAGGPVAMLAVLLLVQWQLVEPHAACQASHAGTGLYGVLYIT